MQYNAGANCSVSSAGFDKSCKDTHSLLTDGTYGSKVSGLHFLITSLFPRSIVPFKNLKFNTNTVIIQILSSLNVMLPENRLGHTGLDVNYTKYSCKLLRLYIGAYSHLDIFLSLGKVRCLFSSSIYHHFLYLLSQFYSC